MKRRGFFGALAGIVAAPVAVKAAEAVKEVEAVAPEPVVVRKRALGTNVADRELWVTCASMISVAALSSPGDWDDNEYERDD